MQWPIKNLKKTSRRIAVLFDLLIPLGLFWSLNNQMDHLSWLLLGLIIVSRILVAIF